MNNSIAHSHRSRMYHRYGEWNDEWTDDAWLLTKQLFNEKCAYCDRPETRHEKLTIDHYWPASKGGSTELGNICPSCKSCNCRKSCKEPFEIVGAMRRWRIELKLLYLKEYGVYELRGDWSGLELLQRGQNVILQSTNNYRLRKQGNRKMGFSQNDLCPSKYLTVDDIPEGQELLLTIINVTAETFKKDGREEVKPMVHVREAKPIIINKSTAKTFFNTFGPNTDDWFNQKIVAYRFWGESYGEEKWMLRFRPADARMGTPGYQQMQNNASGFQNNSQGHGQGYSQPNGNPPASSAGSDFSTPQQQADIKQYAIALWGDLYKTEFAAAFKKPPQQMSNQEAVNCINALQKELQEKERQRVAAGGIDDDADDSDPFEDF